MKTRHFLAPLLIGFMALAGCLPALNPVYHDKDLVFDPDVLGTWVQRDNSATWELTQRTDNSYTLIYTDEKGDQSRLVAHLAELEGKRFLDLTVDPDESPGTGFYKIHLVPIHTIYLVQQTEPHVKLASIDYTWLEQYLNDHPQAIQHAMFGDTKLITAPTDELQQFVLKHQDHFTGTIELYRGP